MWRDVFVHCSNEVRGKRQNFCTIHLTLCQDTRHNVNVNYYTHSLQTISAFSLDQSCIASFLTCLPGLILVSVSVTLAFCPTCPCLWCSAIRSSVGQTPLEESSSIFFSFLFDFATFLAQAPPRSHLNDHVLVGETKSRKLGDPRVFRIRLNWSEH